ncbi:hypothetical protein [Streptomyces sp. NPDC002521]
MAVTVAVVVAVAAVVIVVVAVAVPVIAVAVVVMRRVLPAVMAAGRQKTGEDGHSVPLRSS